MQSAFSWDYSLLESFCGNKELKDSCNKTTKSKDHDHLSLKCAEQRELREIAERRGHHIWNLSVDRKKGISEEINVHGLS